jgi:predicted ATPase
MNFPTPPIETRYDYYKIIPEFKKFASQYIGKNYLIPDEEKPIVFATIAWMLQDDLVAKEMDFDLQKGILLSGPIGCGKTTLLKLMQKFIGNKNKFGMVSTRQIVSEFMQSGYQILENYSKGNFAHDARKAKVYCFDDLGIETASYFYTTRVLYTTLTATTHIILLQFSNETSGTISVRDASIELIRVS